MTRNQAMKMLSDIHNATVTDAYVQIGTFIIPTTSIVLVEVYPAKDLNTWGIQVVFKDGSSNMVRQYLGDS